MKKLILLVVVLASLVIPANSQSAKGFGGLGFYYPGFQTMMPKSLSSILPASYPEVGFSPIMSAGGGYVVFYNFLAGAEGGDYNGGTFTKDGMQVDLTGGLGSFKLGYIVYHKEALMLYPFGTYGSNIMELYIHQTTAERSFGDVLDAPAISSRLTCEASVFSIGVGGLYTLFGSQNKDASSGFMLGVEAGYQLPLSKGTWTYDNGAVLDGPDMNFQGFFVRLAIGGGGVGFRPAKTK